MIWCSGKQKGFCSRNYTKEIVKMVLMIILFFVIVKLVRLFLVIVLKEVRKWFFFFFFGSLKGLYEKYTRSLRQRMDKLLDKKFVDRDKLRILWKRIVIAGKKNLIS